MHRQVGGRSSDVRWFVSMEFSEHVLRHLPPPPLRVLEVGCGSQGGVTPALVAAGYDVLAVDPRAPEGPNYRRITLEQLEPEPFDAVVAGRVLHHVTPLGSALAKLAESRHCSWRTSSPSTGSISRRSVGTNDSSRSAATPAEKPPDQRTSRNGGGATPISIPRKPC